MNTKPGPVQQHVLSVRIYTLNGLTMRPGGSGPIKNIVAKYNPLCYSVCMNQKDRDHMLKTIEEGMKSQQTMDAFFDKLFNRIDHVKARRKERVNRLRPRTLQKEE